MLCLILLKQLSALFDMPEFLRRFYESFQGGETGSEDSDIISRVYKGLSSVIGPFLILGVILASLVITYGTIKHKKGNAPKLPSNESSDIRNLNPLLPQNYPERIWAALLSLNAGLVEELFFRLLAPILIFMVSGSALWAIVGSTLWFGLAHYYQGLVGILITGMVGFLLFFIYLMTQSIWLAMLVHTLLDLNGLVLGPWLQKRAANHDH